MVSIYLGFPGGAGCKESACQCRRLKRRGFDPWIGEDPLEEEMATHSSILVQREGESGAEASQAPVTSPTLPQPAPSRARMLEAGERCSTSASSALLVGA